MRARRPAAESPATTGSSEHALAEQVAVEARALIDLELQRVNERTSAALSQTKSLALIGAAAVVGSTDRATAGALVGAAQRLLTELGAVVTPRQADDVAAVRALLGEHKEALTDPGPEYEALAVIRAGHALDEIEGSRDPGTR